MEFTDKSRERSEDSRGMRHAAIIDTSESILIEFNLWWDVECMLAFQLRANLCLTQLAAPGSFVMPEVNPDPGVCENLSI